MREEPRLFLRLGDRVYHEHYEDWGGGAVVETMTSTVWGGTCLVRILFQDGLQRTFNNDLDHEMCCAFMGVRRAHQFDWEQGRTIDRTPRKLSRS